MSGASQSWTEVWSGFAEHSVAGVRGTRDGAAMTTVLFFAGLALLGLLVMDVYSTVFVPRGSAGLISRLLYRRLWGAWRWLADRRSGEGRRLWLATFVPPWFR